MPAIPGLGPHKIDIQQGNVVTQEMVDKLQPGMTRSQVRFVLGTPLVVDPFRNDRWDYVYSFKKRGDLVEQRQLRVFFKDDKMERYEGDALADAKPGSKPDAKPVAAKPAPVKSEAAKPAAAQPAPQPEAAKPALVTPARDPDGEANIKPNLRLSPNEGQPATPEERAAPAVSAPAPAPAAAVPQEPASLDTPPLPRLKLPPEAPEQSGQPATLPSAIPGQGKP